MSNTRISNVIFYVSSLILIPSIAHAQEKLEDSLAEMLSYLQEKVTDSRVSYDGGFFINEVEYANFEIDIANKLLIVEEHGRALLKTSGQVVDTVRRRLTIPLATLDPEETNVSSQPRFSNSRSRVFFVTVIVRNDESAITFEGREKRGDKPEKTISGAWSEYALALQDGNSAETIYQALIRAIKLSEGKKE